MSDPRDNQNSARQTWSPILRAFIYDDGSIVPSHLIQRTSRPGDAASSSAGFVRSSPSPLHAANNHRTPHVRATTSPTPTMRLYQPPIASGNYSPYTYPSTSGSAVTNPPSTARYQYTPVNSAVSSYPQSTSLYATAPIPSSQSSSSWNVRSGLESMSTSSTTDPRTRLASYPTAAASRTSASPYDSSQSMNRSSLPESFPSSFGRPSNALEDGSQPAARGGSNTAIPAGYAQYGYEKRASFAETASQKSSDSREERRSRNAAKANASESTTIPSSRVAGQTLSPTRATTGSSAQPVSTSGHSWPVSNLSGTHSAPTTRDLRSPAVLPSAGRAGPVPARTALHPSVTTAAGSSRTVLDSARRYGGSVDTSAMPLTGFKPQNDPQKAFKLGTVLEAGVVLHESLGSSGSSTGTVVPTNTSERLNVHRFVMIAAPNSERPYFRALRISTYGGQGVGQHGVIRHHHVIIHTSREAPSATEDELPPRLPEGGSEAGLLPRPIRVTPRLGNQLSPMARLNYMEIHEFPTDYPVRIFGQVHDESVEDLTGQFRFVCRGQTPSVHRHNLPRGTGGEPRGSAGATSATSGRMAYISSGESGERDDQEGLAEFIRQFENMRMMAAKLHMPVPTFPVGEARAMLTRNPTKREAYFTGIKARWRAIGAGQSMQPGNHDEDEDEEDEEEEEDDDDDDNDDGDEQNSEEDDSDESEDDGSDRTSRAA